MKAGEDVEEVLISILVVAIATRADVRNVVIDSPHTDNGRQMHLIDINSIVG